MKGDIFIIWCSRSVHEGCSPQRRYSVTTLLFWIQMGAGETAGMVKMERKKHSLSFKSQCVKRKQLCNLFITFIFTFHFPV